MINKFIYWCKIRKLIVVGMLIMSFFGHFAAAQSTNIEGTWKIVSATLYQDSNNKDEKAIDFYDAKPQGILFFDQSGNYSLMVFRSKLKNYWFESGNRETGTADENRRVVQWSIANYGTYSIGEECSFKKGVFSASSFNGKNLTLLIEAATFPNWFGAEQKRCSKVEENNLTYIVHPASTGGDSYAVFVWKRAK